MPEPSIAGKAHPWVCRAQSWSGIHYLPASLRVLRSASFWCLLSMYYGAGGRLLLCSKRRQEVGMSGHSKWATIKHKKAALDSKRGKSFTRVIKEITIAARNGGDPDANPRLRTAILAAKAVSMPADNIKRAIMRGTGELEGGQIDEITFEGYGPGGAAVLVAVATDNRNRTVSEIRHLFSKNGGNLGEQGSVSWMFERKSHITIEGDKASEDQLM